MLLTQLRTNHKGLLFLDGGTSGRPPLHTRSGDSGLQSARPDWIHPQFSWCLERDAMEGERIFQRYQLGYVGGKGSASGEANIIELYV